MSSPRPSAGTELGFFSELSGFCWLFLDTRTVLSAQTLCPFQQSKCRSCFCSLAVTQGAARPQESCKNPVCRCLRRIVPLTPCPLRPQTMFPAAPRLQPEDGELLPFPPPCSRGWERQGMPCSTRQLRSVVPGSGSSQPPSQNPDVVDLAPLGCPELAGAVPAQHGEAAASLCIFSRQAACVGAPGQLPGCLWEARALPAEPHADLVRTAA